MNNRSKTIVLRKRGISPIIATLLLIVIAIAAGVVVYAYVLNFAQGMTTGQPTGTSQLSVSLVSGSGGTGNMTAFVQNTGGSNATINAFYILDSSGNIVASYLGAITQASATACSTIIGSSSMDCILAHGTTMEITVSGLSLVAGSSYTLKVTTIDGSSATGPFKAS